MTIYQPAGHTPARWRPAAAVLAALAVATVPLAASAAPASAPRPGISSVFYTTSGAGTGLPNGAEIFAITVRGATVTTRDVGPTHGGDCGSLALSPHGTLYSMCGPLFGARRLATIDQKTCLRRKRPCKLLVAAVFRI